MPTFTDDELRKHDEEIAAKAADLAKSHVQSEVLKNTSWTSLEALRESAQSADRRIGDAVKQERETKEALKTLETQLAELKKPAASPPAKPPEPKKDDEISDPGAILRSMTDEEQAALDEMLKADADLRAACLAEGDKSMASTLLALRKKTAKPGDKGATDSPFAAWRKHNVTRAMVSLDEAMTKAHENFLKRQRIPPSRGRSLAPQAPISDGDESRPVRSSGGMMEFAAPGSLPETE